LAGSELPIGCAKFIINFDNVKLDFLCSVFHDSIGGFAMCSSWSQVEDGRLARGLVSPVAMPIPISLDAFVILSRHSAHPTGQILRYLQ